MNFNAKIYVAGHNGLVGSGLVRALTNAGYNNIVTRAAHELDLRNQKAVNEFFQKEQPEYVFLAAAKVGGIKANAQQPASFLYDNVMIETNVIHAAYRYGVKKLLFLGSSCIYPRECRQPICEDYLLTGPLESTNESYAIAKIAGIKLCQSYARQYGAHFICCMPTNLYGPGDNFDRETSHVIPALIAKIDKAKEKQQPYVTLWGTGNPRREFLYVDDLAQALLFLMHHYNEPEPINVGIGQDITIKELAHLIKDVIGYEGEILFNANNLDGTPQKLLNVEKINNLGWRAKILLKEGLQRTYAWYMAQKKKADYHKNRTDTRNRLSI